MASRRRTTHEEICAALQNLAEWGLIEDSGRRCPGPTGEPQVVWVCTPLSDLLSYYRQLGLTFEEAVARVRAEVNQPH